MYKIIKGRLTDGKGTTVTCRDAIFIMTSNLAQHEIAEAAPLLRSDQNSTTLGAGMAENSAGRKFVDQTIYPILKGFFGRDEFLVKKKQKFLIISLVYDMMNII